MDRGRGSAALERLAADAPGGHAELIQLDLADLAQVESFSTGFMAGGEGLDLRVNNAGIMAIPHRETTAQGYERQFGTNHLGCDQDAAARLWAVSEELTGVTFEALTPR